MQLRVTGYNLPKYWARTYHFFASADFSGPNPGVVTFLAGDGPGTSRNTVFTIVNDNDVESDETITMSGTSLSALGQFQAGGDTAVITITDNDGRCLFTVQLHNKY